MKRITAADIARMSVEEKINLVEDLWNSIPELPEAVVIPEWHKAELCKRLVAYRQNPKVGSPWAEVRRKIIQGGS